MLAAMHLHATRCQDAGSKFLSDRSLAKGRAGTVRRSTPTATWQDKSRDVRPVRCGRKHLSAHCSWTACHGTKRGAWHRFEAKGDQKSRLFAALRAPRAVVRLIEK